MWTMKNIGCLGYIKIILPTYVGNFMNHIRIKQPWWLMESKPVFLFCFVAIKNGPPHRVYALAMTRRSLPPARIEYRDRVADLRDVSLPPPNLPALFWASGKGWNTKFHVPSRSIASLKLTAIQFCSCKWWVFQGIGISKTSRGLFAGASC